MFLINHVLNIARSKACKKNIYIYIYMGTEKCEVKYQTKNLGLIVDNECSFKQHTDSTTARCLNRWRELRYHCTGKWGLSRHTLTVMYKTLILPALLYCTPVWASRNITKLTKFQHANTLRILRKRFETTGNDFLCPRRAEVQFGKAQQIPITAGFLL